MANFTFIMPEVLGGNSKFSNDAELLHEILRQKLGQKLSLIASDSGQLNPYVQCFLNGVRLDSTLVKIDRPENEILVLTSMSGG